MTKPVILTGLRANNDLHIGNYFGGMLPLIEMAKHRSNDYQINLFIPDLHSFTTPIDHGTLQGQILNNARLYAAAGLPLDRDTIHLYRQSYIPAHSELTWILDCFTGFGEMRRMTQFKDKSNAQKLLNDLNTFFEEINKKHKEVIARQEKHSIIDDRSDENIKTFLNIFIDTIDIAKDSLDHSFEYAKKSEELDASVGIFNYPVLMASDMLLYGAEYIPVGDDQSQHIEFTRDIGERINNRFGEIFTLPLAVNDQHSFFGKGQGLRIKDLVDPTKKMSKSDETGKGVIFLGDDPDVAAKKIMGATTDDKAHVHFDRENQPGISNLLEILALLRGQPREDVVNEFEGMERYGDFKKVVADEVKQFLTDFQTKLAAVDDTKVLAKLEASEKAMNEQANATLLKVQQAVGLRPKDN